MTQPPPAAQRTLSLDSPALADFVNDIVTHGAFCWLRVTGRSMVPAIPSGSVVRLGKVCGVLRSGDVALAQLPSGAMVLHRVVRADAAHVVLRGDGNIALDPMISTSRVIAVADAMAVAGSVGAIPARSPFSPRRAWRYLRAAMSRGWRAVGRDRW